MNCTNCNTETVAEHAMALYFATRRSLVTIHNTLADFDYTSSSSPGRPNEWKTKGSMNARMRDGTGKPPRTCKEEVAGIIGYGAVGKHIARLCTALGMKVLISSRKDATSPAAVNNSASSSITITTDPTRVPFTTLLSSASVLFLAVPLSPTTRSLISTPELALLLPSTTIINVSRGGIVDEDAVLAALRARKIFGYGTDVFATEPAGDGNDSCLLDAAAAVADAVGEEKVER
ncbi:hypothetical protein N0V82_010440, partial [Gnomoniopsis sp. IMI 355080]